MMRLWYQQPAEKWDEALPIGNGRLGGMVKGGVNKDHLQINEDSVWYGGPRDRNNPDTQEYLEKIRDLINRGHLNEAEKLIVPAMSGIPENQRHYEPFLDLEILTGHQQEEISNYKRELDINKAVAEASYVHQGVTYTREYLVSAVDEVMVISYQADKSEKINLQARLRRLGREQKYTHYLDQIITQKGDTVILKGGSGSGGQEAGTIFYGGLKVKVQGGSFNLIGDTFHIKNAERVIFLIGGATDFYHDHPQSVLEYQLNQAFKKSYSQIKTDHIEDYQSYFQRVSLDIAGEDLSDIPTDKRRKRLEQGEKDPGLVSLYFNFGRYLLISCSRPGSQAATLQGIWNDKWLPPWDSKYTININLEMNYWPAEVCNLSELHKPLFALIEKMRKNGKKTAEVMYGAEGFCAHHNTDIWGDTAPQGNHIPSSYWAMGAAWLCTHLWEHYAFTQDREFLQKTYPVLKDSCNFFFDFLIEDEKGRLITSPSVSPENTYILPNGEKSALCQGPTMDSQIISYLMQKTVKAAQILNIDDDTFISEAKKVCALLPEMEVGKYGQIMEWAEDYEEAEPGHRHISHLWALHPGDKISPVETPELARAAEKTLNRRLEHGGGHTGWSRAWIINFWARLIAGEKAYENVLELLKTSTLDNLFDNHPPFQIDGNFGGTAGIAEMLVQSHQEKIHLLPALPEAWSEGKVTGLCARGGFEVDIFWEKGVLTKAVIRAKVDNNCQVKYEEKEVKLELKKGDFLILDRNLQVKS
ncbi:MAG: glycosyl hydrolase family 95 catalytic domain-containing protein [Bacillota bacterium]